MKLFFYIFLYLNIYTVFFANIFSQELTLEVVLKNEKNNVLLDSFGYAKKLPDYKRILAELEDLKERFYMQGYVKARIDTVVKLNDSVFEAKFNVGDLVLRYAVIRYDSTKFSKEELTLVSKKITDDFFVVPFNNLSQTLDKLVRFKVEQGFTFFNLKLDSIRIKGNDTLVSKLVLFSSKKRVVDSIVLKGYSKFSKSHLKYLVGLKQGDLFNKKTLLVKNLNLKTLPFVSAIKPPEVLFTDDKTTVYFYLKKEQTNVFDGIIGFSTDEKTNRLQFNGYLDLLLINNLNYGEELGLYYKADGNDQQNFTVRTKMPYLFASPVGLELFLNIFKRDTSFVTTKQKTVVNYQVNSRLVSSVGYQTFSSTNLREVNLNNQIEDFKSSSWVAGLNYKKTQDKVFFPVKTQIDLVLSYGVRKNEHFFDRQFAVESTVSNIFNLDRKNAIFVRNTTAYLSSSVYLENELFRFGGIESIRGFAENTIDASFYSFINTCFIRSTSSPISPAPTSSLTSHFDCLTTRSKFSFKTTFISHAFLSFNAFILSTTSCEVIPFIGFSRAG